MFQGTWYAVLLIVISLALVVGTLIVIWRQPRSEREPSFAVPFNPWLPGVSILVNIYLMMQLDVMTWIRFMVWIAIGLAIYFGYGMWHSKERPKVIKQMAAAEAAAASLDNSLAVPQPHDISTIVNKEK